MRFQNTLKFNLLFNVFIVISQFVVHSFEKEDFELFSHILG